MGVMQALVSFVQAGSDMIRSVHAGDTNFVFVVKGPLILVAVSKTLESVPQLTLQLTYVLFKIISFFDKIFCIHIFMYIYLITDMYIIR